MQLHAVTCSYMQLHAVALTVVHALRIGRNMAQARVERLLLVNVWGGGEFDKRRQQSQQPKDPTEPYH